MQCAYSLSYKYLKIYNNINYIFYFGFVFISFLFGFSFILFGISFIFIWFFFYFSFIFILFGISFILVFLLFFFYLVFLLFLFVYLCGGGSSGSLSLDRLGKVRAHEALKIEVGKDIGLLELEKRGKLGIRVNLATILLVLKVVGADVCIDVTGHRSASHLSSLVLSEERSKLVTDAGGLHETTGGAVSGLPLALGTKLLGSLKLALPLLLKGLVFGLKGRDHGAQLLELSIKFGGLLNDGSLKRLTLGGSSSSLCSNGSRSSGRGSLNGRGLGSLLGLGGSLHCGSSGGGSINNGSGNGLNGSIGRCLGSFTGSDHIILYHYTYYLSDLTQYIYYL